MHYKITNFFILFCLAHGENDSFAEDSYDRSKLLNYRSIVAYIRFAVQFYEVHPFVATCMLEVF